MKVVCLKLKPQGKPIVYREIDITNTDVAYLSSQ